MKKTILLIAGLAATVSMMAQGTLNFNNRVTGVVDAKVTHADTGVGVTGDEFFGTVYWVNPSTTVLEPIIELSTDAVVVKSFRTQASLLGYISGGTVKVKGAGLDQTIQVQVRAWSKSGGATYDAAYTAALLEIGEGKAPTIKLGSSAVFDCILGGGGEPPKVPGDMKNLTAFTVAFVPEPSILALGLLGGAAFLLRRRS